MDDLVRRARAAFYKYDGDADVERGYVVERHGLKYVCLGLEDGSTVVYRLRRNGMLRRMKRPPITGAAE